MIWKPKRNRNRYRGRASGTDVLKRRSRGPEHLEPRRLLAADPIHVGIVYLETDYLETDHDIGGDSTGDRFILSFTGGVADTKLTEVRIHTDKDGDGLSVGDPIYDIEAGNRGKSGAHDFQIVRVLTQNGQQVNATATVEDGGQELVLRLSDFRAGDRLEFSIDVDEVLRNAADLEVFNDRLDVITSGQEFQDSILEVTLNAPNYETSHADAIFLNGYGDPVEAYGLNLPPDQGDDIDSRPDRSAAAIASLTQIPKPIEISGHVWLDNDLDSNRESGEQMLEGVEISLWRLSPSGDYTDTGHRATTGADGKYQFSKSLGLQPGQFRLVEAQPSDLISVAALAGTMNGNAVGQVESVDVLTQLAMPNGDSSALNYDFAEAQPAALSGFVYLDADNSGIRDPDETGIPGVRVQLVPISTIAPQAMLVMTTGVDGSYSFTDLSPGQYEVIELDQPDDLFDGFDSAGQVGGTTVGAAQNPGDRIASISLAGADIGTEYNFAEIPAGSLAGVVYLASPGNDCHEQQARVESTPLAGVEVALQDIRGVLVAQTSTNADGSYFFNGVPVGNYRLVQFTPVGLIDGDSHVGTINNIRVGTSIDGTLIHGVTMTPGGIGVEYDFCEVLPASISGHVYHDESNEGRRDSGEMPIANAEVSLVDTVGRIVDTVNTDADGRYEFDALKPGVYSILATQPAGYSDGIDSVGTIQGQTVGSSHLNDHLSEVHLKQGQDGIEYNFGEVLPVSLAGRVHVDTDGDCQYDDGEPTLSGVMVRLFDHHGIEVEQTLTDADGRYAFVDLPPGVYTILENQPDGYFEGGATAGSVGGIVLDASRIGNVVLASGEHGVDYDFCELLGAELAGTVFGDLDGDCRFDESETGIAGVALDLYNESGQFVGQTLTDANGTYRFSGLAAGLYSVRETQPAGWLQGHQAAGSAGGNDAAADVISDIPIGWGDRLNNYDFCELLPASVEGMVWQETNSNQTFEAGEIPIPGVLIELIGSVGDVLETTETDPQGKYRFDHLMPGVYSIRQTQPDGFFHGGQVSGDRGGDDTTDDLLVGLTLAIGTEGKGYNFPEIPPASLSGFVFQDGDTIQLSGRLQPESLRQYRDGLLTIDDLRIEGAMLELRDASGMSVAATDSLPGHYDGDLVLASTDAEGFYEFTGLRPGIYHVYQMQPHGYVDGLDTAGSTGGQPINAADSQDQQARLLIEMLSINDMTDPRHDAILNVSLESGQSSEQNNFSELLVVETEVPQQPQDPVARVPQVVAPIEIFDPTIRIATFADPVTAGSTARVYDEWAVSWHLSVINGGFPRGEVIADGIIRSVSVKRSGQAWEAGDHTGGRWSIQGFDGTRDAQTVPPSDFDLGGDNAIALSGDFDGDGSDEAVIYVAGQWFVDLNGNGFWDPGDLWIELGTELDRPVVGDWDGDGKDDVGIFGRQWQRDPQRIKRDLGLSDPANKRRRLTTPMGSESTDKTGETDHRRVLQRGDSGKLRADAVDHVFKYGEQVDTPIVGDWNGDGIDQIAVYRGGKWMLDTDGDGRWTNRDKKVDYGQPGDLPVVGDFNGDEIDEIGVVRGDVWIIDTDGDRRITGNDQRIVIPRASDNSQPIVGDFDGDGRDEPGYYDESA
ncbi:MAG: carboxypeptidase regulatory-like domain-containing protein [Rubripirellula sp.]|nr:carboxypeptidase regulatory-like domain-containing protein [Rubripirellula sp.]